MQRISITTARNVNRLLGRYRSKRNDVSVTSCLHGTLIVLDNHYFRRLHKIYLAETTRCLVTDFAAKSFHCRWSSVIWKVTVNCSLYTDKISKIVLGNTSLALNDLNTFVRLALRFASYHLLFDALQCMGVFIWSWLGNKSQSKPYKGIQIIQG